MRRARVVVVAVAAAAAVLVVGAAWYGSVDGRRVPPATTLALGRSIYQAHCAECHGAKLEGQPNWQQPLPSGRLPAPPHDASGHTWHHSDRLLFDITKRGTAAVVGGGYESDMPGFDGVLSDPEIGAVLGYIKSTWPERERRYQWEATRRDRAGGGFPAGSD